MKVKILVCAILLVSASAFAEIRLGALFAVTGPASFLGLPEKQTLEMLVDEVNASGGINGEKVKLFIYDTKGSDQEARKKFLRLVQKDKVLAVIGPTRTGSALAIKDLAEESKIPLFTCAASRKIVDPVAKYVFKSPQSDDHAVEKIFEYLTTKNKSKVAIMTAQNGFGAAGRDALIGIAPRYKIEIVADEKFRDTDKDMTSQLSKIASNNPDAVIVWGVGPAPAIVAKNFRQLNMKGYLIMSHGVASKKFIELAGDAAEGIILPAGRLLIADKLPEKDKFKKLLVDYKSKYESKFNSPVSTFGGHAYDSFLMFKKGVEEGGKDGAKIVAAVEKIKNMIGTAGEFNLSEGDHNGLTKEAFEMLIIKNGNWEIAE
ncbi:ABC transporter substrate-binding protein [Deferribacterales bacterium Es71-Z0220]|uniref:ABC transporter substrate-binding protein n=1 Tax=Deferrivibrio essentukiensis TaxID=2880922 RepID=UPI001F6018F8|nr:ABC transporter substrate-binding protein [Deferrivibrio essentukiensis]MCB4204067.1 ABC transporter substrate-binding protein [Deferrivibrio essentukiensis]